MLAGEALVGLAGDIVRAIDPYTEADPVAVLVQVIAAYGNIVGPGPHFRVEQTRHPARIFAGIVGDTAKARKGQSWSTAKHLLTAVDPSWGGRVTSGLSSGEGLIYAVRDTTPEGLPGVPDKRLFVLEEEFAQPLKVMRRPENILSVTIRQAWDSGDLNVLNKNSPVRSTGAHIGIIGHITADELRRLLNETEQANGFANRFLWFVVSRSKVIPDPTGVPLHILEDLGRRLTDAFTFARSVAEVRRDSDAEAQWAEVYPVLSEGKPGLSGAVLNRAEAQVMRVALTLALLDQESFIRPRHLTAALALWEYSEKSVQVIFGDSTGNPVADQILAELRKRGRMSETEIRDLFNRNARGADIDQALALLRRAGMANLALEETGGRPRALWRPTT